MQRTLPLTTLCANTIKKAGVYLIYAEKENLHN